MRCRLRLEVGPAKTVTDASESPTQDWLHQSRKAAPLRNLSGPGEDDPDVEAAGRVSKVFALVWNGSQC